MNTKKLKEEREKDLLRVKRLKDVSPVRTLNIMLELCDFSQKLSKLHK